MICDGSGEFPTNFDGEFTRCNTCKRRLKLCPKGLVPKHHRKEDGPTLHPTVYVGQHQGGSPPPPPRFKRGAR